MWIYLLGFAPGLFWLWFLRRKDDLEPEPKRLVVLVFAGGCGAAMATWALRPALERWLLDGSGPWAAWIDAFVVTACAEELLKLSAFFLLAFWHREMDEPMDGIIYGAAAGLGFASIENAYYLQLTEQPAVLLGRAFTATLVHAACTGCLGFCLGMTRLGRRRPAAGLVAAGLVTVVLLHGAYDLFLLSPADLSWIALFGALPLMIVLLGLKLRWARRRSAAFHRGLA